MYVQDKNYCEGPMAPKKTIDRGRRVSLRMPPELVARALAAAGAQGETLTALVERALEAELARLQAKMPPGPRRMP